jgi:hypothetical protein
MLYSPKMCREKVSRLEIKLPKEKPPIGNSSKKKIIKIPIELTDK